MIYEAYKKSHGFGLSTVCKRRPYETIWISDFVCACFQKHRNLKALTCKNVEHAHFKHKTLGNQHFKYTRNWTFTHTHTHTHENISNSKSIRPSQSVVSPTWCWRYEKYCPGLALGSVPDINSRTSSSVFCVAQSIASGMFAWSQHRSISPSQSPDKKRRRGHSTSQSPSPSPS